MKEEEEKKSIFAGSLNDQPWSFLVECRATMPLNGFGESEEEN